MALRRVTKEEFFAAIGQQDCHPHILPGPWPYTSAFKLRYGGRELGRIVSQRCETGKPSEFYLTDQ